MKSALINEPLVKEIELGRKQVDDETLIRLVRVFGDARRGYQASYEEWFIAAGKRTPEFFDVLFDTITYSTVDDALADALPSAKKETAAWLGPEPKPQEPSSTLNPSDYQITDGYVGHFGISYVTATEATLTQAIAAAAKRRNQTIEEITQALAEGVKVDWCNSGNYYYDHGVGYIRRKRPAPPPVKLIHCDCGHDVPKSQVMRASLGTSCPDCYDRMSD